jgi:hypothetical protein
VADSQVFKKVSAMSDTSASQFTDEIAASDFSHPISHRTPHYRVGNGAMERSAANQESHIFRDKTELKDTGQDGLQRFRKPFRLPIYQ